MHFAEVVNGGTVNQGRRALELVGRAKLDDKCIRLVLYRVPFKSEFWKWVY